jgi:EAL domain-containing protein (putative c-di-GMP-specific phosphodiesterase class I)/PleD family two-component response regulator
MSLPPARSQRPPEPDTDATPGPEAEMAEVGAGTRGADKSQAAVSDNPYRVLIVEDDRSQALFAESVLSGSGIATRAVAEAAEVLPALAEFQPDLVLMDLHLPDMDGASLTQRIREHGDFAHIPIVFLTGDPDPELQYQVLEVGADDFLRKPIRPRHLIAAVQSRVQRSRAQRRPQAGGDRHPATGLLHRPELMQRIAAHASGDTGGALCVEIQNAGALRDRYGFAGFEHLMTEAGRHLAALVGDLPAARLNDNVFAVFAPNADEPALEALARNLRDGVGREAIDLAGTPQRLRASVGYTRSAGSEPEQLLDHATEALREARSTAIGLAVYTPPVPDARDDRLLALLREAIASDGLRLAFQPVVAVAGGDEAQFQALMRLPEDGHPMHSAGEVLPLAEANGLMPEIDRAVLSQAIRHLAERAQGASGVRLFVNHSPRTLADAAHTDWLRQALAAHAVAASQLVLDLRLDDALVHSEELAPALARLVEAGVGVCLSQYLHGSEADVLLAQLPLQFLRLSPRYTAADASAAQRDEARGVIQRAHELGLRVIGPSVEDPRAAAALWSSGVDYLQGNLVQEPEHALDFDFQNPVI